MKKNHEIRIKLTKEELEKIQEKARTLGLSSAGYTRMMALRSKVTLELQDNI